MLVCLSSIGSVGWGFAYRSGHDAAHLACSCFGAPGRGRPGASTGRRRRGGKGLFGPDGRSSRTVAAYSAEPQSYRSVSRFWPGEPGGSVTAGRGSCGAKRSDLHEDEDELREMVMEGLFERGGVVHVTGDGAVECDFDLVA